MTSLLGRILPYMPQYHSYEKALNSFKVTVIPSPWWRRLLPFWPYWVGNRVSFILTVEKRQGIVSVYEHFGAFGGSVKSIERFMSEEGFAGSILGNPIDGEGDVRYTLGFSSKESESVTVFTARVVNSDRWSLALLGFILGVIGTILAGIALGILQLNPIWRIGPP